jgi:quercetin dioxygenase-like cupin family protein
MRLCCSLRVLRSVVMSLVFAVCCTPATSVAKASSRDRTVTSRALPSMDGNHLRATVIEVIYAPGEFSPPHSHPCPVIGYVLEGAVRMKTKGEPQVIYKAGESFYEAPNGIHEISANASSTKAAKFLAYFLCDRDRPLTLAMPKT